MSMTSSSIFIANFEHITPFFSVSIVDFEQVNVSWVWRYDIRLQDNLKYACDKIYLCSVKIYITWCNKEGWVEYVQSSQ